MAEPSGSVVLDANLLILLIVGSADPRLIRTHKRLRDFSHADYQRIASLVDEFERLLFHPHVLAEAANLVHWGITGPARRGITEALAGLIESTTEHYVSSRAAVRREEFVQLGLTDTVLMHMLEFGAGDDLPTLITIDGPLHARALAAGLSVIDYMQVR